MQMTVVPPSARLAPFVERFVIVESRDETTRVLLPDRGLVLGVRYRGGSSLVDGERATRLGDFMITGVRDAVRRMLTHAGSGIVVAQFRPTGAAAFFRTPLHELFGATVALDALVARADVERLGARVAAAPDAAQRVAVVEQFLLARMTGEPGDPLVAAAVAALEAAHGSLRIGALAESLGISQDPLEKRFRRTVGASPKQLASIIRVRHAIDLARADPSWARVAYRAGYFDQSHFIREFRAITGEAPARFFRAVPHCG